MKKILYLLITMLLLVGCSKNVDTVAPSVDVPTPNGYMAEPQILLSSEHKYKQESWVSEDIDLKDSSISLQGDSFFATIIFQASIPEDILKEAVTVEGYDGEPEVTITPSEGKTVFYGAYRNLDKSKPYQFTISKDIVDAEGKTLRADIQKQITLEPDTIALYTLESSDGSFSGLGWNSAIDPYAVGNMNLSPDPKTIIVDFSAEVDATSVEQSIKQDLNNKGIRFSYKWDNSKKLILKIDGFISAEDEPYLVSMSTAKDSKGNPIYGNLYFLISKPNSLGAIDVNTKNNSILYKFPDKRYMTVQNPKINDNIILDDTEAKYVFNMTSKKLKKIDIKREYTLGIPSLSFLYSWFDSNTLLMFNTIDGTVIGYSTIDGSSKEMFALPIEIVKSNVIEISASPDGSKIAVAYETLPPGGQDKHDFIINVFDIKGNSIYKGENLFKPRFLELFGSVANMKWLDNGTLIMEDNVSKENQMDFNVISVNINSGKKSVIAEHAFMPVIFQGKNIIKVESFKGFDSEERSIDILKDGKKVRSFNAKFYQYDNFFFSDGNTLVYNEKDKLFAYYIDKGKSAQLGNGYIAGLSEDGSKVYYMANHKMLYYID